MRRPRRTGTGRRAGCRPLQLSQLRGCSHHAWRWVEETLRPTL